MQSISPAPAPSIPMYEVEQEIQAAVKRLDSSYFAVVQIDRDYTK